jgi:hypothetical protein
MQAQEEEFSIKITQVYPKGGGDDNYSDTYESGNELKNAERYLRNQYTGKDANYDMELITPSGKETKPIQNIRWILVTNGKEENWKTKPLIRNFYLEPTVMEIYVCNNDGSKIEKSKVMASSDYYYKFFIGNREQPIKQTEYRTLEKCESVAKTHFDKNKPKVDSVFTEIRIFKAKDSTVVTSINNREAHENFIRKKETPGAEVKVASNAKKAESCKNIASKYEQKVKKAKDKNKKAEIKREAFVEIVNCTDVDSTYSSKNVDKNLQLCKEAVEKYLENDDVQLGNVVKKLEVILIVMQKNPKGIPTFERFDYFEEPTPAKLKKGVGKLIKEHERIKKLSNKPAKKKKK